MSFEWDPNEDDSDSDNDMIFCLPNNQAAVAVAASNSETASKTARTSNSFLHNDFDAALSEEDDDDDDNDDMMVNWEDADDAEDDQPTNDLIIPPYAAAAHTATSSESNVQPVLPNALKAVTIDLGKKSHDDKKPKAYAGKRKQRRRNVYKHSQLPHQMQRVLRNLQRAHLLSWASHVTYMASDEFFSEEGIAQSVSVIPPTFWSHTNDRTLSVPTKLQLHDFCTWYTNWLQDRLSLPGRRIRGRGRRRQANAAGDADLMASPLASFLPDTFAQWLRIVFSSDEGTRYLAQQNPYHPLFSNLLFYAMARHGLRWRVRWCMGINDVITMDLHVHHPWLLTSTRNVFLAAAKRNTAAGKTDKSISGEKRKRETSVIPSQFSTDPSISMVWGWMEIWTAEQPGANKSVKRWMDVDLSGHGSEAFCIHGPKTVESRMAILNDKLTSYADSESSQPSRYQKTTYQKKKKKGALRNVPPVAYVLAVERQEGFQLLPDCHWIDLTPRYASSSVRSLQARGLSRTEIEAELAGSPSDPSKWWSSTIRVLNQSTALPLPGSSAKDSIVLDAEEDDRKPAAIVTKEDYERDSARTPGLIDSANGPSKDSNSADRTAASYCLPQNLFPDSSKTIFDLHIPTDEGDMSFSHTAEKEPMPTSKSAFAKHPVYVLKSQLGKTQVLSPDAQKCGLFGGESVYLRKDVTVAQEAHAWLYQNRKVKSTCLRSPVVRLKPRKKPAKKGFVQLASYGVGAGNDGSEEQRAAEIAAASQPESEQEKDRLLYAKWQTIKWSPPRVGPHDQIPMNEHRNVELALLNPGLVHVDMPGAAVKAAKELGVPYAPCMIGFQPGGNPIVRGIIVHEHNAAIIENAADQIYQNSLENEEKERQRVAYKRWKKLMVGILVKQRVTREYGDKKEDDDNEEPVEL